MKKHNQDGVSPLLVPLIIAVILFIGSASFGFWAYGGKQDYKDNTDQKIAAAVTIAKQQEDAIKAKQFAEAAKQPLKTYVGPDQFGSINLKYPKTWSAYVDSSGSGSSPFDAYFQPDVVPSISQQTNNFALRIQVLSGSYSDTLNGFTNQENITTAAYALPKVPKVVGVEITGQIQDQRSGTMIVLPLRGQTLEIYTETPAYLADFTNTIVPNLSFSP